MPHDISHVDKKFVYMAGLKHLALLQAFHGYMFYKVFIPGSVTLVLSGELTNESTDVLHIEISCKYTFFWEHIRPIMSQISTSFWLSFIF